MESEIRQPPQSGPPALRCSPDLLSPRELELLNIIEEGLTKTGFSDEEVAARMDVAVGTVRVYIKRLHQKLQAGEPGKLE